MLDSNHLIQNSKTAETTAVELQGELSKIAGLKAPVTIAKRQEQ
jgi:hypothetical protein